MPKLRHGHTANGRMTPEYRAWSGMRDRCKNPNSAYYKDYGGRGIRVCERWDSSFDAFWADMGPRPDGHSLDRIDNNKGYQPQNCRWADIHTQNRNQRSTKKIPVYGKLMAIAEAARLVGLRPDTLAGRLRKGWPLEVALTLRPYVGNPKQGAISSQAPAADGGEVVPPYPSPSAPHSIPGATSSPKAPEEARQLPRPALGGSAAASALPPTNTNVSNSHCLAHRAGGTVKQVAETSPVPPAANSYQEATR